MELDLTSILTPEAIARLKKEEGKKAAKGKKPEPKLVLPPKPAPSPWEVTAAILVESVITCNCGTVWVSPAADEPLVRFVHKRNGTLWEIAHHPTLLKPTLPREVRQITGSCKVCAACWKISCGETFNVTLDSDQKH